MRIYKPRGLNPDESYACRRMAVRKCFEGQDISVLWGASKNFSFDTRIHKKPKITGAVVASLTRSRQSQPAILDFYIISDPAYGDRQKKLFEDGCLPRMREWLFSESQSGASFDQLLVTWTSSGFCIHELHFA